MKSRFAVPLILGVTLVLIYPRSGPSDEPGSDVQAPPQYNDKGELKRPTGYRTWIFVGANIGLQYRRDVSETTVRELDRRKEGSIGDFHNVYITPKAYEHFVQTGTFPEKTVLVMDVYKAAERNRRISSQKDSFPVTKCRSKSP